MSGAVGGGRQDVALTAGKGPWVAMYRFRVPSGCTYDAFT
jgi:hypothetical protein